MRGWGWLVLVVIAGLAGCSGGGGEAPVGKTLRTAQAHELTVNYLTSTVNLPQQNTEEFYMVNAKLWMPDTAARLNNLSLIIPYTPKSLTLAGPTMVAATDGVHMQNYPLAVYWGAGEAAGAGQPRLVRPGEWLPGYTRPASTLYAYHGSKDFDTTVDMDGSYILTDGASLTAAWSVPPSYFMLPPAKVTKPAFLIINSRQPIVVGWDAVPGATGYFIYAEGDVKDGDNVIGRILWSVAEAPVVFDAIYDPADYLLPATTREVTIPAHIFRECGLLQVHVFAMRAPYSDDTTTPAARITSGSLMTQVYVLVNQ